MRIEDLAVAVKPRSYWEAADMGPVMVRRWWRDVYVPWLIVHGAVAAGAALVLRGDAFAALLVIWWLRPLVARLPLYVLSRVMFGVRVSSAQALKAFPRLVFRLPFFLRMTFCRLSVTRTVLLPVWMLEGLKGADRRRREAAVRNRLFGAAFGIACLFFILEWCVLIPGLYFGTELLLPQNLHILMPGPEDFLNTWWCVAFYVLTVAFLEPFYVATGFALYLNFRTLLEGWDLELTFRRLAARLREEARRFSASAALMLVVLLGALHPDRALASPQTDQESSEVAEASEDEAASNVPDADAENREAARREVQAILDGPPFQMGSESRRTWKLRFKPKEKKEEAQVPLNGWVRPASGAAPFLSTLIYTVLGVCLVVLVFFLIRGMLASARAMPSDEATSEAPRAGPRMADLIEAETLPPDPLAAARAAFASGQTRLAMSLLFRGTLLRLAENGTLQLADFATEGECVREVVKQGDAELASFFTDLVQTWQQVAYGHLPVSADTFERLCTAWHRRLGGDR